MKLKYTFELRKRLIGAANKVIEYPKLNGCPNTSWWGSVALRKKHFYLTFWSLKTSNLMIAVGVNENCCPSFFGKYLKIWNTPVNEEKHGLQINFSKSRTETSEILVSREFSRIFFLFHFSFSISCRFNFTFTSRKRVKGFYFSLFTSRKKWKLSVFHSFFSRKKSEIRCGL